MKKKVIAYLHTHWDREWYRTKEEFNLRLLEVFDEVLDELKSGAAPSFYFDGQTCALEDYLKFRPERLDEIRALVKAKKLFAGPFYVCADSFLCSGKSLIKNLEIGLEFARKLGVEDFIGYLSDSFGHSREVVDIFKKFNIDKIILWRGTGNIEADFIWRGVNATRLVEGYFIDTLHSSAPVKEQAKALEKILDKIAAYSGDVLLLPLGADHLKILKNASEKIAQVNKYLKGYEIELSTPFEYFKLAKYEKTREQEFLDNSANYTLPGVYSSRIYQKVQNALLQWEFENIVPPPEFRASFEYAYKELIKNHAHDSIYGCSIDEVHRQVQARFERAEQVLNGIKKRNPKSTNHFVDDKIAPNAQVIRKFKGFPDTLLYDAGKIPVTEDYTTLYEQILSAGGKPKIVDGPLINGVKITLSDVKDVGDSYNFAPGGERVELPVLKTKLLEDGHVRRVLGVYYKDILLKIITYDAAEIEFEIEINNKKKNHKLQINFELPAPVKETVAEDLFTQTRRYHDPDYSLFANLPAVRPVELKTNSFPLQRFVWAQGFGVFTKGLNEYEIYKNTLSITLLRATGVLSNPKNRARSIPAGPPLLTPDLQCQGVHNLNLAAAFCDEGECKKIADEFYGKPIIKLGGL